MTEMAAGIELVQHYAGEALRLYCASQIRMELQIAQRALDWLLNKQSMSVISLPDLYRRGPAEIRDAKTARQVITILEEHGWLMRIPEGAEIDEVYRREAWQIVKG
ncbi:MAG: hypothetical protein JO007_10525 [Alphaproteobacteria bacterium]|nr:hypothetical protein [Alphaproteobacteria bacterium]